MSSTGPDQDKQGDCYSAGERAAMQWTQDLRARMLRPLLVVLTQGKVGPNVLTFLSLMVGLSAAMVLMKAPLWGLVLLALHVALDGLDGPLARHQQKESHRGSFADTMADQIVITAVMLVTIKMGAVDALAGGLYIFFYTLVVAFAIVRNYLRVPYTWVLRPRFIFYGWLLVEFYLWPGTLNYLVWVFNLFLVGLAVRGFYRIHKAL